MLIITIQFHNVTAIITGITGQDGAYIIKENYKVID